MKNKVNLSVHLLLLNKDNILMLRRYNTGYEDGNYSLVAGHVEKNETVTEAIIRESYEEGGIKIVEEDLEIVHVIHRKKEGLGGDYIDYFFKCTKWSGDIINKEPNKCDDLRWFNTNSLPANTIPYIKHGIKEFLNNSYFSEFNWEKKL